LNFNIVGSGPGLCQYSDLTLLEENGGPQIAKPPRQVTHGSSIVFVIIEHLVAMTVLIEDIFLLPGGIGELGFNIVNPFKELLLLLLLLRKDVLVIGV
jgi:hypothetical protein